MTESRLRYWSSGPNKSIKRTRDQRGGKNESRVVRRLRKILIQARIKLGQMGLIRHTKIAD